MSFFLALNLSKCLKKIASYKVKIKCVHLLFFRLSGFGYDITFCNYRSNNLIAKKLRMYRINMKIYVTVKIAQFLILCFNISFCFKMFILTLHNLSLKIKVNINILNNFKRFKFNP